MNAETPNQALRILCVTPLFVPVANAEAFCGAKMVMALVAQGADVQVLCDSRYLEGPDTGRDSSAMWEPASALAAEMEPADRNTFDALTHAIQYRAYSRWADATVRRARELHAGKPFDLVYSRSLPMQGHVVGYWCSRALRVPWVANINDPWDTRQPPVKGERAPSPIRGLISAYWARKTLREADLVTFPCERLRHHTVAHVGTWRRPDVVPHVGTASAPEPPEGIFRLVHAGCLGVAYKRSARSVLSGLKDFLAAHPEARRITRFTFIGPKVAETETLVGSLGLQDVVESVGRVSYEESLRWIARASVCVLVEANIAEGIFLPSKLADYLMARKPVLALSPAIGTVADMVPDPGIARVGPEDRKAIAEALAVLYEDFRRDGLAGRKPSEPLVQTFDSAAVVRRFLAVLRKAGIGPTR